MTLTIDARGLPCPQPVIRTRNAMREAVDQQNAEDLVVLVSTEDQAHNVQRLAEKKGWTARISVDGDTFRLDLSAALSQPEAVPAASARAAAPQTDSGPSVVVVTSSEMGEGDPVLGEILMRAFFHTLTEVDVTPCKTIILYNGGVFLATGASPVAEDLALLEASGVEVLACGTCLQHYGVTLAVGSVTNMYTIAETLLEAGRIIRP